jgi:hypothetical protein
MVREGGPLRRVSACTPRCTRHVRPRLPRWRTSSRCCARAAASGPRWPSSHATGGEEETVRTGEAQAGLIGRVGSRDGRMAVGGRGLPMAGPLTTGPVGSRGRTACGLRMAVEVQGNSTAHGHLTGVEVQDSSTVHGHPTGVGSQHSSTARGGTPVVEGRERLTADGPRTEVEGRERLAAAILHQLRVEGTRGPANPGTAGAAPLPWSPTCPAVSLRSREAPPRSRERLASGGAPP